MNSLELINKFKRFLTSYSLTIIYSNKLLQCMGKRLEISDKPLLLIKFCETTESYAWISAAFDWDKAVYGYDWWNDINNKWIKEIRKFNQENQDEI